MPAQAPASLFEMQIVCRFRQLSFLVRNDFIHSSLIIARV